MVQSANERGAAAERSLKEALMQMDGLQAEVRALKTLVITSTPSAPNLPLRSMMSDSGLTGKSETIWNLEHAQWQNSVLKIASSILVGYL